MKKAFLAATAITLISTSAMAENQWPYWYLGLSAGGVQQRNSDWDKGGAEGKFNYEPGYTLNASLGYRPHNTGAFLLDNSRIEVEGSYRRQKFDGISSNSNDSEVATRNVSLNYFYDFAPESGINPYIGGGLGYGNIEFTGGTNAAGIKGDDKAFNYQLMTGLGFQFEELPHTEFNVGYRYFAPFKDLTVGGGKVEFDSHAVEAGARFRF
jgi:opacity protein-like surface antigen